MQHFVVRRHYLAFKVLVAAGDIREPNTLLHGTYALEFDLLAHIASG